MNNSKPTSLISWWNGHKLSKCTQEEIDNMKRPIFIKEIESVINNLPKQNSPGSNGFTGEFYQALRKKLY